MHAISFPRPVSAWWKTGSNGTARRATILQVLVSPMSGMPCQACRGVQHSPKFAPKHLSWMFQRYPPRQDSSSLPGSTLFHQDARASGEEKPGIRAARARRLHWSGGGQGDPGSGRLAEPAGLRAGEYRVDSVAGGVLAALGVRG